MESSGSTSSFSPPSVPVQALATLLGDQDPRSRELLAHQALENAEAWRQPLRELAGRDQSDISAAARSILHQVELDEARTDFDLLCRFFPENGDLESACWALARAFDPIFEVEAGRQRLNAWGRQLLLRIAGAVSNRERVRILGEFMAGELQFRGNCEDYYNPRNSFLPAVLETRAGLPIALCSLAIFISHRAGMNVVGVNLPGHFIARHGDVLFDPFHAGKILKPEDCRQILLCQGLSNHHLHLEPASPRSMLRRILANLLHAYRHLGPPENTQFVERCIMSLPATDGRP
jgi:regulator of sirC expression with transglutaminase-like and TPR domain